MRPFCQRFFLVRFHPLNLRQNSSGKFLCGEKLLGYCGGAILLLRSSLATTPSRIWTTR